jgi:hypothetical protein
VGLTLVWGELGLVEEDVGVLALEGGGEEQEVAGK